MSHLRSLPRDLKDREETPLDPFSCKNHDDLIWAHDLLAMRQWKSLDTGGVGWGKSEKGGEIGERRREKRV